MTDEIREPADDDLELDADAAEDVKGGATVMESKLDPKVRPPSPTSTPTTTTAPPRTPIPSPLQRPPSA